MNRFVHVFDAAVVGGGPAGAAAAITLARTGVRTVLIDREGGCGGFKVGEALPPAAKPLLQELGVWQCLAADGHIRSYGNESAWGSSLVRSIDFVRHPHGHGWQVDRRRFDARLLETARGAGVMVLNGSHASAAARADDHGWRVQLQQRTGGQKDSGSAGPAVGGGRTCDSAGGEIRAAWLVDCTGRQAAIARRQGAARVGHDRLIGIAALFRQEDAAAPDPDSTTFVESAPYGWWYTARLPNRLRTVVCLTDAGDRAERLARTPSGYRALVRTTRHLRTRLASHGYVPAAPPRAIAACSGRLDRFTGDGWLAAGDAAVSFDPLSSQGILTALYSGVKAARALDAHMGGAREALAEYERSISAVYAAYLANRIVYYRQEWRWPDQPFWRRRHEPVPIRRGTKL